jgi:hypothetical protein
LIGGYWLGRKDSNSNQDQSAALPLATSNSAAILPRGGIDRDFSTTKLCARLQLPGALRPLESRRFDTRTFVYAVKFSWTAVFLHW